MSHRVTHYISHLWGCYCYARKSGSVHLKGMKRSSAQVSIIDLCKQTRALNISDWLHPDFQHLSFMRLMDKPYGSSASLLGISACWMHCCFTALGAEPFLSVSKHLSTQSPMLQLFLPSLKAFTMMVTEKEFSTSPAAHLIRYLVSLPKESKASL